MSFCRAKFLSIAVFALVMGACTQDNDGVTTEEYLLLAILNPGSGVGLPPIEPVDTVYDAGAETRVFALPARHELISRETTRVRGNPLSGLEARWLVYHEIYLSYPDGTRLRFTYDNDRYDSTDPSLAPDGNKIVYTQYVPLLWHSDLRALPPISEGTVYVADVNDPANRIALHTRTAGVGAGDMEWSPDSSRLIYNWERLKLPDSFCIYYTYYGNGCWLYEEDEYWLASVDGNTLVQLDGDAPMQWSPDGSKILFADGDVVDADGNNRVNASLAFGGHPVWSPDSSQFLVSSGQSGDREIYVVNADGSGVTNLTNDAAEDWSPVWSPDGSRIAFIRKDSSSLHATARLHVMNADGSGQTELAVLSFSPFLDSPLGWSPDGSRIVYQSRLADINAVNVGDGSVVRIVERGEIDLGVPLHRRDAWTPDGRLRIELTRTDYTRRPYRLTLEAILLVNLDGSGLTVVR